MRIPTIPSLLCCSASLVAAGWSGVAPAAPAAAPSAPVRQVTHSINMDPSLSPDGTRMVYISIVAGREQLFTADIDGKHPIQVTRDDFDHEDPAWSPDGRWIAFDSQGEDGRWDIYVIDAAGGQPR